MEASHRMVKKEVKIKLSKLVNGVNEDLLSMPCKPKGKKKQVKSKELTEFDSYDFNEVTELCYQYWMSKNNL